VNAALQSMKKKNSGSFGLPLATFRKTAAMRGEHQRGELEFYWLKSGVCNPGGPTLAPLLKVL